MSLATGDKPFRNLILIFQPAFINSYNKFDAFSHYEHKKYMLSEPFHVLIYVLYLFEKKKILMFIMLKTYNFLQLWGFYQSDLTASAVGKHNGIIRNNSLSNLEIHQYNPHNYVQIIIELRME